MSNKVVLKKIIRNDTVEAIHFFVFNGIRKVEADGWPREQILIQAPKYFMEMLMHKMYPDAQVSLVDGKYTFFGKRVIPAFSDVIVIYHEDMPMYGDRKYVVVDII